ncbi:MAG: CPBP family intramembrane glutamic endopeptidase [Spirochaetota bacterium]
MSMGKEFALLFAVLFLPGMIAQGGSVDPQAFESLAYHIQLLATSIPQILLVVAFSELRRTGSARRFGWTAPATSDILPGGVALLGVWAVVAVASLAIGVIGGADGTIEPTVDWSFERTELIPIALVSTLAIGYREEIFYRAYIADRAPEAGVDQRIARAAGALLFAAGHLYQGVAGFIVALAIGFVLAEVYLRTRSLHGIAIAHGLYNFMVLLASSST